MVKSSAMELGSTGFEIGLYFLVGITQLFLVAIQIRGKPWRLQTFLASREFQILQSPNAQRCFNWVLTVTIYIMCILPFAALIIWGLIQIHLQKKRGEKPSVGTTIILVGFALFFFCFGMMKISWNNFRLTKINVISLLISVILFSSFQFIITLMDESEQDNFFGYSCMFLTVNCFFVIFIVFINATAEGANIRNILDQLEEGKTRDMNRDDDFKEEIAEELKNASYFISRQDIFDLFTMGLIPAQLKSAVGGGIQQLFTDMNPKAKKIITLVLYLCSLGVMAVYSFVIYKLMNKSYLGVVTSVAIVVTDVILFLYAYSGLTSSPANLAFKAIISRLLLIVYGDQYWIYGYYTLYLYYAFVLSHKIGQKRFPFEEQYAQKVQEFGDGTKSIQQRVQAIPEVLLGFITAVLVILILSMSWGDPTNIPLAPMKMGKETLSFKQVGALSIIIAGLFFSLVCMLRIFKRRKEGITPSKINFPLLEKFDTYWIFWVCSYLLIAFVILFVYNVHPIPALGIIGLIGSLGVLCFLNVLLYYDLNDYNILQDITALNKKIEQKNKEQAKLLEKMEKVKADLAAGNLKSIGSSSAALANTLLKAEELKKQIKEMEANNPISPVKPGSPLQRTVVFGADGSIQQKPNSPTVKKPAPPKPFVPPVKPSKVVKAEVDDEIYEGGEEEEKKAQPAASSIAAGLKKALVFDWQVKGRTSIVAFFRGNLRYNDYMIIVSFILSIILLSIQALALCLEYNSTWGITVTVPFLHYMLAILSLSRHLNTDFPLAVWEVIMLFLAFAGQYAWGVIYFKNNIYDQEAVERNDSYNQGEFLIIYLVLIPFVTSFLAMCLKFVDDRGKLSIMFWVLFSITCIQIVGMIVIAFWFMKAWVGAMLIGILVGVLWCCVNLYVYKHNKDQLPKLWLIINTVVLVSVYCGLFGLTFFVDDFSNFSGFTIIILGTAFLLLVYSLNKFRKNIANIDRKPLYFSPWIFPIYRYSCKKNDVVLHNKTTIILLTSLLLILIWAVLAAAFLKPYWIGICISILLEITLLIISLYLISISSIQLAAIMPFVDDILLKNAWLEAKKAYVRDRGVISRSNLLTYVKMCDRRNDFRELIKLNLERGTGVGKQVLFPEGKDYEWIDEEDLNYGSYISQLNFSFNLDKEVNKTYLEELQLLVHFQLMIISQANQLQAFERKYLFKFIKEKRAELFCLGIKIRLPSGGSEAVRHARVIADIQKLKADQQTMFNSLREHYIIEESKKEEEQKELSRIAEEKERERQERLNELSNQKQKLLANLDLTKPIDQIPDCKEKYQKIVDTNYFFTDNKFTATDSSLGDNVKSRVGGWKRASEVTDAKLFDGQVNYQDITQGMLGDCYFLSAMSVLPERHIREMIITISNPEEWRKVGCFCVCFYKNGKPEFVIIDDFFPTLPNGEWAFVKGGTNKNELWSMVLEKAYAKLNGSYAYIEAGKVQYALADMTDGFPEQIDLKRSVKNVETLWESMLSIKAHGGLMGAGSPENAMGDSAISEEGIVQGHAYAVLQLELVDGYKLLQLRNPHGSAGVEWTGDWSDDSLKWTKRLRTKLQVEQKNDGVFWMSLDDFIENFSYLYVTRILSTKTGWTHKEVTAWWRGSTAEGLPSKANPKARLDKNPQFEVRVSKSCNGFISLLQLDQVSMFKGKHNIFFMVSAVDGDYIKKVDKATMICMSGSPINLNVVTAECDFPPGLSYPYTFTVLVATSKSGQEGTGEFKLSIYATDPAITIKQKPAK